MSTQPTDDEAYNELARNTPREARSPFSSKPTEGGKMNNQPKPTTGHYNPDLATVMLNEGDFEGLADEVGKPNQPKSKIRRGEPKPTFVPPPTGAQLAWQETVTENQHKPTGEWTTDGCTVIDSNRLAVFVCDTKSGAKHLANAHNTALAAIEDYWTRAFKTFEDSVSRQLDAEREKVQMLVDALTEIRGKTTEPWAHRVAWDALTKVVT